VAEMTVLGIVLLVTSFVGSSATQINDIAIRPWLLGQFVLLVWSAELLEQWVGEDAPTLPSIFSALTRRRPRSALRLLFVVGILSTALEAFATRAWPPLMDHNISGIPNVLSPDAHLGERTYAARLAYEYANDKLPPGIRIQNNPFTYLDRPGGLYCRRDLVVADRVAYGVPREEFQVLVNRVGAIFIGTDYSNWHVIDQICSDSGIGAIVVKDTDPLWRALPLLTRRRRPLYQNQYYLIVACGDFAAQGGPE
jgi:hypothetical protein